MHPLTLRTHLIFRAPALATLVLLAACSSNPDDGENLAPDTGDTSADVEVSGPVCGDNVASDDEACDGSDLQGATCTSEGFAAGDIACGADCTLDTSLCRDALCGDGFVDGDEACDDGNTDDGDGCSADCRSETCGDGVRQDIEVCDGDELGDATCVEQGFPSGDLSCTDTCTLDTSGCVTAAACGDGTLNDGEACDDGNNDDGDGCAFDCVVETCGDGIIQGDEACDGGAVLSDRCDDGALGIAACEACDIGDVTCPEDAICGDGELALGEACDVPDPTQCDGNCASLTCGDEALQAHEACDGALINGLTCASFGFLAGDLACRDCAIVIDDCHHPRCGDGRVEGSEACDDGNREPGDGCSGRCALEGCGDGVVGPDEACDEGEANSDVAGAACRTNCQPARCGDGILDMLAGEACDEGAHNSDAAGSPCHTDCQLPACGDGILDVGERCDAGDGNADVPNAPCRTTCEPPRCGDGIVDDTLGELCDDADELICDASCVPPGEAPVAALVADADACADADVYFDASGSTDVEDIVTYVWDLGDGTAPFETAVPYLRHQYANAGADPIERTATVTVRDSGGRESSATYALTVYPAVPSDVALWIGDGSTEAAVWSEPYHWCTDTGHRLPTDTDTVQVPDGSAPVELDANVAVGGLEVRGTGEVHLMGLTLSVTGDVSAPLPAHLTGGASPGLVSMVGDGGSYEGYSQHVAVYAGGVTAAGHPERLDVMPDGEVVMPAGAMLVTDTLNVYGGGALTVDVGELQVTGDLRIDGAFTLRGGGTVEADRFIYGATSGVVSSGTVTATSFVQLPTGLAFDVTDQTVEVIMTGAGDITTQVVTGPLARFDDVTIAEGASIALSGELVVGGTLRVQGNLRGSGSATLGPASYVELTGATGAQWNLEGETHVYGDSAFPDTPTINGPMVFHNAPAWSEFYSRGDVTFTDGATFDVPAGSTLIVGDLIMDGASTLVLQTGDTLNLQGALRWHDASVSATGGRLQCPSFIVDAGNTGAVDLTQARLTLDGGADTAELTVGGAAPSFNVGTFVARSDLDISGVALALGSANIAVGTVRFLAGAVVSFDQILFSSGTHYEVEIGTSVTTGSCITSPDTTHLVGSTAILGCEQ